VRFSILTAVKLAMFWVMMPCRLVGDINVPEKHAVSIFRASAYMAS
jgi:hypothetical protein